MKKSEIKVGQVYRAKVSNQLTEVRVDDIRETSAGTRYDVHNLRTGRKTTFRSSQKFRALVKQSDFTKPRQLSLADRLKQSQEEQPTASSHVIVVARAGTGKTTTLVEGLKYVKGMESDLTPSPQQAAVWEEMKKSSGVKTVCFVAFNKSIATELQQRVPEGCEAMTMHSMGFKAVQNQFGRVRVNSYRVQDIISELLGRDIRELRKHKFELIKATERLVSLCKMNLIDSDCSSQELWDLASAYDVDLNGNSSAVFDLVPRVIERCKDVARDGCIDFNDMIWIPVALNLNVFRYQLLLVDEAQDLNRCQQELACKAGQRLILCGDPKQAIYGFAGADSQSMSRMFDRLNQTESGCIELPLTVTRRCGKAIVQAAQQYVPDFEAHESNGEGKISQALFPNQADDKREGLYNPQDGDMCLCRVNAPLVSQCFRFLKAGRKATIQGRDVGQGLISTIKKMKATNIADLEAKLSDWFHSESQKESAKRNPNEARLIALQDRYDCLQAFTDGCSTIEEVIKRIEAIFVDDKDSPGIRFSSIHKAKGLEAKSVFFLQPEGAPIPHPMAKSPTAREQEFNLIYVATTRAIEELVIVK